MKVFLDLDGVLVNFGEGTYRVFGKDYDYLTSCPKWLYFEDWGISFDEFDSVCGLDFFAGLRWMHDGKQILKAVESKFKDMYLLTTPMPNSGSWTGKMLWIERHLPQHKKQTIMTRVPKSILAGPDTLLIDDKDENIAEFVVAGGQGILVPRPWNELRGWAGESLQVVEQSLEAL